MSGCIEAVAYRSPRYDGKRKVLQTALSIADCDDFIDPEGVPKRPKPKYVAGPYGKALAVWVREMRADRSQPDFEKITSLPQSTISAIERGERQVLPDHVDAILEATGMTVPAMARMLEQIAKRIEPAPVSGSAGSVASPAQSNSTHEQR